MDYVQLSLDDYIQCKTEIKENLTGIVKSFVRIGWQLTRINASKAYTMDGYSSIAEFAQAEYGMNRSGVSRFMNVYERYSLPGDTPELQERYKDFEFSQLSEMLQLTEEDQNLITADTKRADIRELKKFNKENEHNPEHLLNWKKGEGNKLYETIYEFFKSSKETLNDLFGSDAYRAGSLEQMVDIINPSGSRSFRKGTVFLMMHGIEKGIMVKQIPQGTRTMPWSEFFNITQDLFGEKASGGRTWEAYFESQKKTEPPKSTSPSEDTLSSAGITPEEITEEKEPKSQEIAVETKEKSGEEEKEPIPEMKTVEKSVDDGGKSQKMALNEKTASVIENSKAGLDFIPQDTEPKNEEKSQETALEEQIPGQDSILNHEEYMPKPVAENPQIAPAQQHEVVDKPIRRKEYLDSLTEYGAADYIARAFKGFGNITFSQLQNTNFWLRWMDTQVDHLGRPWVE